MKLRLLLISLFLGIFAMPFVLSVTEVYAKTNTVVKKPSGKKNVYASKKISSKAKKLVTSKNKKRLKQRYAAVSNEPEKDKFAAVVVDAATGHVLYQKNANDLRYPASLTKMMTLYLTFDALKKGKITLASGMSVSKKAAEQPETNINLIEGNSLLVEDAIKALVIRSANDAAVVVAEKLGGTTWNFAQMMNKKARELGMKDTVFRNPNGLPDTGQYTVAYDMARLGIALRRDFPEYYNYFKVDRFEYGGVTYTTHNRVLLRYDGADGIKTGYIRASGFNVVTSVQKNGYQIVAVVMGGKSATTRDDMMINMLERTFASLPSKRSHVAQSNAGVARTAAN